MPLVSETFLTTHKENIYTKTLYRKLQQFKHLRHFHRFRPFFYLRVLRNNMSYCTVEEAWGPNFGRTNPSLRPPSGAPNTVEHFASGNAGYNNGKTRGYEDEHGHYGTVEFEKKEHTGPYWAQRRDSVRVPYARDDRVGGFKKEPSAFYPLDENAGKEHIMNFAYDYDEEPQLGNTPPPSHGGCSAAFDHLLTCKTCRMKIIKTVESAEKDIPSQHQNDENNDDELDITELALFVALGVFFIFLLDALVKLVKRFK